MSDTIVLTADIPFAVSIGHTPALSAYPGVRCGVFPALVMAVAVLGLDVWHCTPSSDVGALETHPAPFPHPATSGRSDALWTPTNAIL